MITNSRAFIPQHPSHGLSQRATLAWDQGIGCCNTLKALNPKGRHCPSVSAETLREPKGKLKSIGALLGVHHLAHRSQAACESGYRCSRCLSCGCLGPGCALLFIVWFIAAHEPSVGNLVGNFTVIVHGVIQPCIILLSLSRSKYSNRKLYLCAERAGDSANGACCMH